MPELNLSRRGLLYGVVGATAIGGLLAACGGGDPNDSVSATSSVAPKRGGRLRAAFIGGSNESRSVLAATLTAVDFVRARLVWDTLGDYDEQLLPRWRAAESCEPNADGTEWTVRIRDGITFSTGKPLTSADVLFSIQAMVTNKVMTAQPLTQIDLANASTPDQRTLVLPLTRPDGVFDLVLSSSTVFLIPEGTTDFENAPGTGPYNTISEYQAGQSSLLVRNPEYWDSDNGGPYLDEIEIISLPDATARLNAVKSGDADYAAGMPLTIVRTESTNAELQLIQAQESAWINYNFTMNSATPEFADPSVAQALRYAVDRPAMVEALTFGLGKVGNDLLGQGSSYYDDSIPQRERDVDKAKQLLADAGVSDPTITIRTSKYDYGMLESASLLVDQAKEAGITIELNEVPANEFYTDFAAFTGATMQTINNSPRPLPLDLRNYYGSEAATPFTGMATPEMEQILQTVRTAMDTSARKQAVSDALHYLHDNGGDLIHTLAPTVAAASPGVHGVEDRGLAAYPSFANAFLA